jgi:hypothetical protein
LITGDFPTHPNREFFAALQGIKSGDQATFRPDEGNPLGLAIFGPGDRALTFFGTASSAGTGY